MLELASIHHKQVESVSSMVAKKRKSKRQTLQQKFKIIKRTQEHHKRIKKGAIVSSGKKKSVDNHIPNAWPYKEELLKEIQSAKDKMEEVRVRQMEKRHEEMVGFFFFICIVNLFLLFIFSHFFSCSLFDITMIS